MTRSSIARSSRHIGVTSHRGQVLHHDIQVTILRRFVHREEEVSPSAHATERLSVQMRQCKTWPRVLVTPRSMTPVLAARARQRNLLLATLCLDLDPRQ